MIEKNINYDINENFYSIEERPQNEIDTINELYKAMRILKEYCENCEHCTTEHCAMQKQCGLMPYQWKI